jgi:hypothetical protein
VLLKPIAAIRDPPAHPQEGNRRTHSPPEWQGQIGKQAQHAKCGPEDLSLHMLILSRIRTREGEANQADNTACTSRQLLAPTENGFTLGDMFCSRETGFDNIAKSSKVYDHARYSRTKYCL